MDDESQFGRLPPFSMQAEMMFLGSFMCCENPHTCAAMARTVAKESLFQVDHQIIYSAALALAGRTGKSFVALLHAEIQERGKLEEVGGAAYLGQIMGTVADPGQWESCADIINRMADRRKSIAIADDMLRIAYEGDEPEAMKSHWAARSHDLAALAAGRNAVKVFNMGDAADAMIANRIEGKSRAVRVNMPTIDAFAGWLSGGCYTLVAAYPGVGKSTFARWILSQSAKAGIPAGLIAVEEDKTKIGGNYLSSETDIVNKQIAYGFLTRTELDEMKAKAEEMRALPWFGVDSAMKLSEIVGAFEKLVLEHGVKVMAVDHIQCIWPERGENENEQLTAISRTLKGLAKRHEVALMVLSQLKKPQTQGIPDPPTMNELRGSGSMFQDCDCAVGLHRPDVFNRDRYTRTGVCQVEFFKARNFDGGRCDLRAEMEYQRFAATVERDIPPDFSR